MTQTIQATRIDQLIAEHCPNGVERRPLGTLVRIRNGKDHKGLVEGTFPAYGTGGVLRYVDTSIYEKPSVLIPRKGSLDKLYYVNEPFWTVDTIFYTEIGPDLLPKYLYYYLLKSRLAELNEAGGVPSLTQSKLNRLPIPVPPLPVQEEIVRILDTFTQLEAELEAELEARQQQYDCYLSEVFSRGLDEEDAPLVPLREVGTWYGGGTPSKGNRLFWENGSIPWISPKDMKSSVVRATEDYVTDEAVAKSATRLVPAEAVALVTRSSILQHTLPIALVPQPSALNQDMKAVVPHDGVSSGYLYYALFAARDDILRGATRHGGSVTSVISSKLMDFRIPLPSLARQHEIAEMLEAFDRLINDLSVGLPAEISARRRQYEFYRDRLLSFEELVA